MSLMYTLFQELLCLHLSTLLEMLHDAMYQTTEKNKDEIKQYSNELILLVGFFVKRYNTWYVEYYILS